MEIKQRDLAPCIQRFEALLDHVVVPRACRLAIVGVPELIHIATMRIDMIYDLGRLHSAYGFTAKTQRMLTLVGRSTQVPSPAVAALTRTTSINLILALGLLQGSEM